MRRILIALVFASLLASSASWAPLASSARGDAPRVHSAAPQGIVVMPSARGFLGSWAVRGADGSVRALVSETPDMDLRALLPSGATEADLVLRFEVFGSQITHANVLLGWNGELSARLDDVELLASHAHRRFRRDQRLLELALDEGVHELVLHLVARARGDFTLSTRILDQDGRPGLRNAILFLPREISESAGALQDRAFHVDATRDIANDGAHLRIDAGFPAGGVVRETAIGIDAETFRVTTHDGVFDEPLHREWRVDDDDAPLRVIEGERSQSVARVLPEDVRLVRAHRALANISNVPDAARGPVAWRLAELARMVREQESDAAWRALIADDATQLARALSRAHNPFASPRGYVRMGFMSRLDDTAQPYELFVPPAYRDTGDRRWPLVITLHGHSGNAGDYFRNTFGLSRPNTQTLVAHGRHGVAPTQGPMFVVAPTGRGQSQYRYAGEEDILEVMADVMSRFRIDPNRIYITGGSMGGTGAAYLPFRHPGLFAASAALAGYHDQRVRSDTHQDELAETEQFLRAERSDVDWAVNAQHLPMLLIRGTMDVPLPWTTRLVDRLASLRYRYEHRQPISRHNVWTENYADGAIFRWFAPHRRPTAPRDVRFVTARERHRDAWWVQDVVRAAPDVFASVNAHIERDGLVVATEHTASLTLAPGAPGDVLHVRIDDEIIDGTSPLRLARNADAHWQLVDDVPVRAKRPHVSGPIRDVYNEPLLFVVGTQDAAHTWINEEVAREWANPLGWTMQYPIVRDVDVTDAMIREKTLVLLGPPHSNSVLARLHARLPIQITRDAITVGNRTYVGPEVGTVFVAPNPEAPDHSLLVIAGSSPFGTWRSLFVPELLPDYVVFNEEIASARDTFALGGTGASYLTSGFFDMDWRLAN